jgi:List-Bact-rpt repeat protein
MLGRVANSSAASLGGSRRLVAALGLVTSLLALGGTALAVSRQVPTDTLTVFVGGPAPAKVFVVSPPPQPALGRFQNPCDQLPEPEQDVPCEYALPRGTVKLRAEPAASFLRWSDPECGSNPECETTVADAGSIVASFSPVRLVLQVGGYGTLRATPVGSSVGFTCGPPPPPPPPEEPYLACPVVYPNVTDVEIEATPSDPGGAVQWSGDTFCDPGPNPSVTRCRTEVNYDPFYVGVGFSGATPPGNFIISVTVHVGSGGDGSGRITGVRADGSQGQIINCGADCSENIEYARRVVLTADPDSGSTFERWGGICSTNPRCEFSAGAVTRVRAIFRRAQPPPPPPPQPPPPPPPRPQLSARILGVSVVPVRGTRVVRARMSVNHAAAANAQVKRGRRALARRAFRLRAGINMLRLPLRASVRRGPAWFAITVRTASGESKGLRKRFLVPRRR